MITYKFKTNINCENCVAKVTEYLNNEKSIEKWEVDTKVPEKVLTVTGENLDKEKVKEVVEKAGFVVKGEVK
ncbi:MAG TPA: cation transporter [Cytophagaceae bacterium]